MRDKNPHRKLSRESSPTTQGSEPLGQTPRGRLAVLLIVASALGGYLWLRSPTEPSQRDIGESVALAERAIEQRRFDLALEALAGLEGRGEQFDEVFLLRAGCLREHGRYDDAVESFLRIEADGDYGAVALSEAGEIRLGQGQISEALELFRRSVATGKDMPMAIARIGLIEAIAGRAWRAGPLLRKLLDQNAVGIQELSFLSNPMAPIPTPEELRPETNADPLLQMGYALWLSHNGETPAGLKRLNALVASANAPKDAWVIRALLSRADPRAFRNAVQQVPVSEQEHPEFWTLRGRIAFADRKFSQAIWCGLSAQRILPDHARSLQLIREAALEAGNSELAEVAAKRSQRVQVVNDAKRLVNMSDEEGLVARSICEALLQLGRTKEAEKWAIAIGRRYPNADWTERIRKNASNTPATTSPLLAIDRERFDRPTGFELAETTTQSPSPPAGTALEFRDDAVAAGLTWTPFVRPNVEQTGRRMQEFTGSGVGVIDYDLDRRPDMAFPMTADSIDEATAATGRDRLYRNAAGARFVETTEEAFFGSSDFSQGVATGDVNDDGFPDIYVANVGTNLLYLNNGDGTFQLAAVEGRDDWTASCAVADIDGDGIADLVDANYVQGKDVYTTICEGEDEGAPRRACSPLSFLPTADAWIRGNGDGTFERRPLSDDDTIVGNGLGLLVGRLGDSMTNDAGRGLDVYVANDLSPNHLYRRGVEEGLLSGVALNRDGVVEAGMGIGWADATGDGIGDLFVTNFTRESNTLYAAEGGFFVDRTSDVGLEEPSYLPLGFGTQFLDADLDGDADLFISNGHIDDFSFNLTPFAMKPLLHRNDGGRFSTMSSTSGYVADRHVGRAVARMDWNGDHRSDLVVTHLIDRPALLTNVTKPSGQSGSIRLVGVNCARDAVGAVIQTVHPDTKAKQILQVTAGDGYMASNSKTLQIATGSQSVVRINITWPDGTSQTATVTAGEQTVIVQKPE